MNELFVGIWLVRLMEEQDVSSKSESDALAVVEVANNRGDEGILQGAVLNEIEDVISDSDEEDGVIIHAGHTNKNQRKFDRTPRTFNSRIQQFSSPQFPLKNLENEETIVKKQMNEELKKLRYSHHRTAFDVDIDGLELQPWRNKNADISDYFNYGFTERTWQA